jgi:hypothetical protein
MTESDAGHLIHLAMQVVKAARLEGQNGGHQSRVDTDCAFDELQQQIMRHVVLADDDRRGDNRMIVVWQILAGLLLAAILAGIAYALWSAKQ